MIPTLLLGCLLGAQVPTKAGSPALVVVNKDENSVSIVDLGSGRILASLPTGAGPHEVAASRDGRWAVVTDYGSQIPGGTLTVVDLQALKVARTILLAPHRRPHGAAFLADSRTVAVTSETSQMVLLVDVESGEIVREVPTTQRGSHMVAVDSAGRHAVTANIFSGSLSAVDLTGAAAARVLPVAPQTEAIGLSPNAGQAWLGSNATGKVYAVDLTAWSVLDSIPTSGLPYRVGFTPDGRLALVTNPDADLVWLIDAVTRRTLGSIPVSESGRTGRPFGLAFSPDGTTAWVTLRSSAQVAELDLKDRKVRRYLATGAGPDGIAYVERR